jgi:hypothetical protein
MPLIYKGDIRIILQILLKVISTNSLNSLIGKFTDFEVESIITICLCGSNGGKNGMTCSYIHNLPLNILQK